MSGFANFCFCSANSISALPLLKRGSSAVRALSLSLSLSCACIWISIIVRLQLKPNCRIIFEEAVVSFVYFFEYFLRKFEFFFVVFKYCCVSREVFFS